MLYSQICVTIMHDRFETLNAQLIEARKTVQERDRILSFMAAIHGQLSEKRRELSLLVTQLKYEKQDVAVLEGLSLEAFFYTLLGCKEEQLEKETAEYLDLKMATQKCRLTIARLENQLHQFEADLVVLADCQDEYTGLQQLQLQMLLELERSESNQLRHLLQLRGEQCKLEKAYQIGQEATEIVSKMISLLASGFDRGSVAKAMELDNICQRTLNQFQDELKQIAHQSHDLPTVRAPFHTNPVPTLGKMVLNELLGELFKKTYKPELYVWLKELYMLRDRIKVKAISVEYQLLSLNVNSKQLDMEIGLLIEQLWQPDHFSSMC